MPDLIIPKAGGGARVSGSVAARFAEVGFNPRALRTLDTLRKEEWNLFDTAVVNVARQRLNGIADLQSRGLTMNLQNGLGTMTFQWEDVSDMTAANINMDGVTAGEHDRVTFDLNTIPLPIIHKDFHINRRALEASRKLGQTLDTTQAEVAARKVIEQAESILFNGASSLTFGGGTLYGYTDHPDVNPVTLSENWDASGKTGEEILADVLAMINAAHSDFMFGPYVLYVPAAYWVILQDDFKTNSDRTILERIRAVSGIADVKPSDTLAANTVLMVQMQSDTVREIIGLQPTVVQWEEQGGMRMNFKVMAIMVPRIASDHEGKSGIVVLS